MTADKVAVLILIRVYPRHPRSNPLGYGYAALGNPWFNPFFEKCAHAARTLNVCCAKANNPFHIAE